MDDKTIEKRRMTLLARLSGIHPLAIFYSLEQSQDVAFIISDAAAGSIREGLAIPQRRQKESSALAGVKLAAQTPDKSHFVYEVHSFRFENIGTESAVLSVERDHLEAGEIEVHTHLYTTPDYLGHTDVGDLVAALEGPAWVHPSNVMQPALRIFGILSVYKEGMAQLRFYRHDLCEKLIASNNYGLKTLGMPITLQDAYSFKDSNNPFLLL